MTTRIGRRFAAPAAALALVFVTGACGPRGATSTSPAGSAIASPSRPAATAPPSASVAYRHVRLQLPWAMQAQFAGYLAANEQGYFEAAGIEVEVVAGDPGSGAGSVIGAPDAPEFVISWVPRVLGARAAGGSDLVHIAQIFQRSGTLSIAWRDAGITAPADLRDRAVGVLGSGYGSEVIAAAVKAGLTPGTDFTTVELGPTVDAFLTGDVDAAQAMVYDGYAQVLEATDRATGGLYQPTVLDVINYNDEGTAMLQDGIFASASWLAAAGNEDVATAFLKALFQGWIYCREHPADCVEYTVAAGSRLGAGHQAWMMNEVNPLIWPSPDGIGIVDAASWQRTIDVAIAAGVMTAAPPPEACRTDLAEAALAALADVDTTGTSFVKGTVEVTPGGT